MHIAFHIGANCTDQERLLKAVLRNASALLSQGIVVPGPSKYRRLLRETIEGLDGRPPKPGTRDILMDAILEEEPASRLVLANDNFISIPKRIFDNAMFYPQVELKVGSLSRLFPDDEITFFIGMRHPAAFLQEVAHRAEVVRLRDFLGQLSPLDLRWSDVIGRIRRFAPQARVVTWCNEDTPLIWEDLIRMLSGVNPQTKIVGQLDIAAQILTPEGLAALKSALAEDPQMDRLVRHELIASMIETHGTPDAMVDEVRYPELGDQLIAAMTELYEEDLDLIDAMDGVELILPFR
jgi:hypothetical protein